MIAFSCSLKRAAGPQWRQLSLIVAAMVLGVQIGAVAKEAPEKGDDAWLKQVAAMPAAKQVEAVAAKLKERNPGFDGKMTHKIEDGVVTEMEFLTDKVTDVSPVRALTGLRTLRCNGTRGKGKLADLSPLKDMKLTSLECGYTKVSDLLPLKNMKLTVLWCNRTKVNDLSPLKGMPLDDLSCDFKPERDAEILRSIKTLVTINQKPAKEFWKEVKAKR